MADRRNPVGLAVELSLHLRLWRKGVELEADRLRTAPTIAHRHIDGYFLVVAIRQVLLSAEAMNKAIKGQSARPRCRQSQCLASPRRQRDLAGLTPVAAGSGGVVDHWLDGV
jgi:hypothetical protein